MRSLPDRKKKVSLVVEFLEDRQLLSHPGSSMGWNDSALGWVSQIEPPAPIRGPMVGSGEDASPPSTVTEGPPGGAQGAGEDRSNPGRSDPAGGFSPEDRASSPPPQAAAPGSRSDAAASEDGTPSPEHNPGSAPTWGPTAGSGDQVDRSRPGSVSDNGPTGPPLAPGGNGPSMPVGPTGGCSAPSPTSHPGDSGGPLGPGQDRPTGDGTGPGSAGSLPTGAGLADSPPPVAVSGSKGYATDAAIGGRGPEGSSSPNPVAQAATSPVSHAGSSGSIAGPSPSFVPTSRVEPIEILPVPSTVDLDAPIAGLNVLANGSSPIEVIHGPGSAVGQPRLGLDDGTARSFAEARPPDDASFDSGWEAGETQAGSELTEVAGTGISSKFDAPEPQAADMITSLLPFDRSTLEAAIDQLLEPLDGFASTVPGLRGPMGLVTASMTVAVTVLAVDLALRIRRSRAEELEVEAEGGLVAFPGLPGTRRWSRP